MEDDKIPLHLEEGRSDIVVQTRAKFDSLLEDALSQKRKGRKGKRKSKSKNKSSTSEEDFEMPTIRPRLAPLKIRGPITDQVEPPVAPPRHKENGDHQPIRSQRSQDDTVIDIGPVQNDDDSDHHDQESHTSPHTNFDLDNGDPPLVPARRRQSETIIAIPEEPEVRQESPVTSYKDEVELTSKVPSPSKTSSKRPKSSRKLKKSKSEDVELQPISSPVSAPGCVSIKVHGCCSLPHRAAPQLLRAHVVDTQSATELMPSQHVTLTTKHSKGDFWQMELELNFPAPLQLAVETPGTVIFLELLTVAPPSSLAPSLSCYPAIGQEKCLAWSFLKLRSTSEHTNCDMKLRLQLYEPLPSFRRHLSHDFKLVHGWWCRGPWRKIPGCCWLEMTVQASTACNTGPELRDDKEKIVNVTSPKGKSSGPQAVLQPESTLKVDWLKRPGQLCRVPTSSPALVLPQRSAQCLALAFSPTGEQLACAAARNLILVYQVPSFKETCTLSGHQGLVYDLTWRSENELFSASADCTVIEWDVDKKSISKFLPHPTFVYCCVLCDDDVVTGCKDGIVRIWRRAAHTQEWDLWQELEGHEEGFVTSLSCIPRAENLVASADSEGVVLLWRKNQQDWSKDRQLTVSGLGSTSICSLVSHPLGSRIIVHARDSLVRSVDITTSTLMQKYAGALTHKVQTGCCLSPCGSLLYAGSEDGSVLAWQSDTGQLMATLPPPAPACPPVTALAHHPKCNLLVSGHFGVPPVPLAVWTTQQHDKDKTKEATKDGTEGISQDVGQLRLKDIIAKIDKALVFKS